MTENLTSPDNLPPDGSPALREGMLLTHLLIVRDVDRSRASPRVNAFHHASIAFESVRRNRIDSWNLTDRSMSFT